MGIAQAFKVRMCMTMAGVLYIVCGLITMHTHLYSADELTYSQDSGFDQVLQDVENCMSGSW